MSFDAVPRFSPEHFGRVELLDPLKRKQLQKGIHQLAEEGTLQLFEEPGREKDPIVGVVGKLQFDVLIYRLENEYGAKIRFNMLPYTLARWVESDEDKITTDVLHARRVPLAVNDVDAQPVALFRDQWEVDRAKLDNPSWRLLETAPIRAGEG